MAENGERNTVQVGSLGKVKTTLQMLSIILLLLVCPVKPTETSFSLVGYTLAPKVVDLIFGTGVVSLYVSTLLTLISGYQYFQNAWETLIPKPKIMN